MKTDVQRITDICTTMRKWLESAEREIDKKENDLAELRERLLTAPPEQAELIREMIEILENQLENVDRPQLEVLRLDISENCGPA